MSESRIVEIAPEDRSPEQSAVIESVVGGRGRLPTPFKVWLHRPALAALWAPLGTYLANDSTLSEREVELAIAIVARHWSGTYVFEAHVRRAAELGCPPEIVAAIRSGSVPVFSNPREHAVYVIAMAADDAASPSDPVFDDAVAALGRDGLADLLALIGYFSAVSIAMKFHNVPLTKGA